MFFCQKSPLDMIALDTMATSDVHKSTYFLLPDSELPVKNNYLEMVMFAQTDSTMKTVE